MSIKPKAIRGKKRNDVSDIIEKIDSEETGDVFSGDVEIINVEDVIIDSLDTRNELQKINTDVLPDYLRGKDLLEHFKTVKNRFDSCVFDIAEAVYYIHLTEAYKSKYSSFEVYVHEEFGRDSRSGYMYVQVYDWVVKNIKDKNSLERAKKIGYTKCLELAKAKVLPDEVSQYLDIAEKSTTRELQDAIDQVKKVDKIVSDDNGTNITKSSSPDELFKRTFSWYTEQYEIVKEAIDQSKKMANTTVDSNALYNVCLSYLNDVELQEDPRGNLISMLKKIENLAKIKLVAIDASSNNVLYGEEMLED